MEKSQIKSMEDMFAYAQKKQGVAGLKFEDMPNVESKANENLNTGDTNWYSAAGLKNNIMDLTYDNSGVMALFQKGKQKNSGSLPDTYPVPYNVTPRKMKSKTEWADEARPSFDNRPYTDAQASIVQKPLIIQAAVSDEFIDTSLDADILAFVKESLVASAQRTIIEMIINGDIETGATGNVNSDDQAAATTFTVDGAADCRLLLDGLRAEAVAATNTYDVSALDLDDMIAVRKLLGDQYKNDLENLATLWNTDTWLTALTDDSIKLAINTGQKAAIDGGSPLPFGGMHATSDVVRLTEADGKESATAANNVKGQFITFYMPAVVHGFGKNFTLEVERIQGYGFEVTATMRWGFDIVDPTNTVAVGRNITV